jgi:holo-[acyl-carrier protein] synthase
LFDALVSTDLAAIIDRHGPAVLGIPMASAAAIILVGLVRALDGPIALDMLGVKAEGAGATAIIWIAAFLAFSRSGRSGRPAMILGIGGDLCHVNRIRHSLTQFGDAYVDHLFSVDERVLCEAAPDPVLLFARGFCGKEACAKALATGMSDGVGWRDIEVLQSGHATSLRLSNGALERLIHLAPVGFSPVLHITCSGDKQIAQAVVVISAVSISPSSG